MRVASKHQTAELARRSATSQSAAVPTATAATLEAETVLPEDIPTSTMCRQGRGLWSHLPRRAGHRGRLPSPQQVSRDHFQKKKEFARGFLEIISSC